MSVPVLVPSSGPNGPLLVVVWRCCRDWPVSVMDPVGRCGLCGERPEPVDSTAELPLPGSDIRTEGNR